MNVAKRKLSSAMQVHVSSVRCALSNLRAAEFYISQDAASQGECESVVIATIISYQVLDVTHDNEAGLFYASTQTQLVDQVINEVNECEVINIDATKELIYPLWLTRHQLAIGKITPWNYLARLNDYLPAPKAKFVAELYTKMGA